MQQTDRLDLELYEPTDNANLMDGYNASMRKIDQRDGEVSLLITALGTTVQGFDGRITAADAAAAAATQTAGQALAVANDTANELAATDGRARAAQADAQEALTAIGNGLGGFKIRELESGVDFDYIGTGFGTNWDCNLLLLESTRNPNKSIIIGHVAVFLTNAITSEAAWTSRNVFRLRDWRNNDNLASWQDDSYSSAAVLNQLWYWALSDDGTISLSHRDAATVEANHAFGSSFVILVRPRA